ncbi:hypothetical protein [Halobacterium salinarum]|uniref:hypothetical protein n=1 Tax=Halobacterium salinarum TaxID=2242 RepID=UPI002555B4B4|nr:hypothetical protein [Halobacterium salinarum]MDL0127046.1 hypothetical protein [Halobacterium salinarum]
MSTIESETQDCTDSRLDGESDPDNVAAHWIDNGVDEPLADGETRYYAVRQTIERELADTQTLAGQKSGRGEHVVIHVLYVRSDGHRAVEREYDARVQELDGSAIVDPAALGSRHPGEFYSSLAVSGESEEPFGIPRSEAIVRALDELHDIQADRDEEGDA